MFETRSFKILTTPFHETNIPELDVGLVHVSLCSRQQKDVEYFSVVSNDCLKAVRGSISVQTLQLFSFYLESIYISYTLRFPEKNTWFLVVNQGNLTIQNGRNTRRKPSSL